MPANTKRVAEPASAPIPEAARAFPSGGAREELAATYHVTRDLLRRTPNLPIVSGNGASDDTVNTKDCTQGFGLVPGEAERQPAGG